MSSEKIISTAKYMIQIKNTLENLKKNLILKAVGLTEANVPYFCDETSKYNPDFTKLKNKKFKKSKNMKYIGIQTNNIHIIDEDNKQMFNDIFPELKNLLEESRTPKYMSRNKKGYHYFVKIKNLPEKNILSYRHPSNKNIFDILCGQASWCNNKIENHESDILELDFNNETLFKNAYLHHKINKTEPKQIKADIINKSYKNIHNYIKTHFKCSYSTKELDNRVFFDFNKSKDDICPFCDKAHKKNNTFLVFNKITRKLYHKCRKCEDESKFLKLFVKKYEKPTFIKQYDETIMFKYMDDEDFESAEKYFLQYHFLYRGTKATYMEEIYNNKGVLVELRERLKRELIDCYDLLNYSDGKKNLSFIKENIITNRNLRNYQHIIFNPIKKATKTEYNIFKGFQFNKNIDFDIDESKLTNVLFHIKEILCDGNEKAYEYFLNRWSCILQKGKCKIGGVCVGLQGTGKTSIFQWFGKKIIGEAYYSYINNMNYIDGTFSEMRDNKIYFVCDELGTYSGNNKQQGILKSIITETKTISENKFKSARVVENWGNFEFISNNYDIIKVENGDRRYFCLRCSSDKKNDVEYFNTLNKDFKDNDVCENFFHFLMNRNISKINFEDIPDTNYRKSLLTSSTPQTIIFLKYFLTNIGLLLQPTEIKHKKEKSNKKVITITDLFFMYGQWCDEKGLENKYDKSYRKFKNKITKDFQEFDNLYKKYYIDGKQKRVYDFTESEKINTILTSQYKYFEDEMISYEQDDDDSEDSEKMSVLDF